MYCLDAGQDGGRAARAGLQLKKEDINTWKNNMKYERWKVRGVTEGHILYAGD